MLSAQYVTIWNSPLWLWREHVNTHQEQFEVRGLTKDDIKLHYGNCRIQGFWNFIHAADKKSGYVGLCYTESSFNGHLSRKSCFCVTLYPPMFFLVVKTQIKVDSHETNVGKCVVVLNNSPRMDDLELKIQTGSNLGPETFPSFFIQCTHSLISIKAILCMSCDSAITFQT